MRHLTLFSLAAIITACQTLPEHFQTEQLSFTAYRDTNGEPLVPIARIVSDKRRQIWQQWLTQNRQIWHTEANQTANGITLWCVQWQQNQSEQRICNRNNQTLVWFGYGQSNHPQAIQQANQIWTQRP